MSSRELVEGADNWELPLEGREVTQCCVDYALTLILGEPDATFSLAIEQRFWFAANDCDAEMFVPESSPAALGPPLAVLHQSVKRAIAYKDGRLELEFSDGMRLRVPASEKFEAWNLVGPAGLRLVSLPSGGLAVWQPDSDAPS